jgi:uncharacterized protein
MPMVLVMFLLGLVVGREGLLDESSRYAPFLRRWWKIMLPIGLVGNALLLIGWSQNTAWLVSIGIHVGAPALSFVYLCAVMLNVQRLTWLAPIGRTALSSYLTHSLVATTLFYGYGLGMYDQLSPALATVLVFLIFGTQVILSAWWLRRFRFGPMEWLWRSLTYGTVQPIRVNA